MTTDRLLSRTTDGAKVTQPRTAFDRLVAALEVRGSMVVGSSNGARALCPAHNDHNPSLSVGLRDDGKGAVVNCFAGCQATDIMAALDMTMSDLFDDNDLRAAWASRRDYEYRDGRRVHRRANKTFRQSGNMADRSLFHADCIGDATNIYVTEGEKDVEVIEAVGATAVCSAMGAGKAEKFDWTVLAGRNVIVVADKDEAGRKHAADIVRQLDGIAACVRIVEAKTGKDAADHIAAGHALEELIDVPLECEEPTTWEPVDLGPYLRGEITPPQPDIGMARSDGVRFIYAGREHTVLGETESGKTWFALGCAAAELLKGNHVVYVHYEEPDATSTIERLRLLGVPDTVIATRFHFVAPIRAARREWLAELLAPRPSLVVHDGVNEAMSLHGADIMAADGAATFRRALIVPCTRTGAATLACDHLPMVRDGSRRDAYGSVHKGNALDGARIVLENEEPFGRGLRGVSHAFVTKDRPGYLRAQGRATKTPGKTFIGTLVVDDSDPFTPFEMPFYAPSQDANGQGDQALVTSAELGDIVHGVIAALPDQMVGSLRQLFAEMRAAGKPFRERSIRMAVDDLVVQRRVIEVPGRRGANGYRAVPTAAQAAAGEGL